MTDILRGRLAPSPTGELHLGHARSFLLAWWSYRARGGEVVLRLDDLDGERCRPEFEEAARRDLRWLGLDWDGEVVRQSSNRALHLSALERLLEAGLAYPCTCTRSEIRARTSTSPVGDAGDRYPGTCRGRYKDVESARTESGRKVAVRLAVEAGRVTFVDGLFGEVSEDVSAVVGDFIIGRKDGEAAYQLSVVLDDADQGVTEVVRGRDLLSSTARQILVHRALGIPVPAWIHVPLVVDGDGARLAKRTGALALATLREQGVQPERIVAWAARSSGISGLGDLPGRATPSEVLDLLPAGLGVSPLVGGPVEPIPMATPQDLLRPEV